MRVTIIAAGRLKEKYLHEGIEEYLKRLKPFAQVNIIEIADEAVSEGASRAETEKARDTEGERMMRALPERAYHIALDIKGDSLSSEEFAALFEKAAVQGISHMVFTIGGSVGLAPCVMAAADLKLSFGAVTYPHQLMRLILTEQIYRAFKINRREPYHK